MGNVVPAPILHDDEAEVALHDLLHGRGQAPAVDLDDEIPQREAELRIPVDEGGDLDRRLDPVPPVGPIPTVEQRRKVLCEERRPGVRLVIEANAWAPFQSLTFRRMSIALGPQMSSPLLLCCEGMSKIYVSEFL